MPEIADWAEHVFHLYVIESDRRDALARDLQDHRIQTGIHYPVPIHLQPAFSSLGYAKGSFPESEALADRILSLPMHPAMTRDDVDLVARAIRLSQGDRVRPGGGVWRRGTSRCGHPSGRTASPCRLTRGRPTTLGPASQVRCAAGALGSGRGSWRASPSSASA